MAKCEMIRSCAGPHLRLLDDIEKAGTSEERKRIGTQLTGLIVQCLKSQGVNCVHIPPEVIHFPGVVKYDVIKNLSTVGLRPEISCHKFDYETGSGSGSPSGDSTYNPPTGSSGTITGSGSLNIGGYSISPITLAIAGVLLLLILKK